MASLAIGSAEKAPNDEKHLDQSGVEVCSVSVRVENQEKLGNFVLKQLESEANRILATGGAAIHVTFVAAGRADYTLQVQDFAPRNNVEGDILGQTFKQDPRNSYLFIKTFEEVWHQTQSLPRGGRGVVYARVYAHELAAHGILGWVHSQAADKDMGFLGSGKNWSGFLFNNLDDTKFEFSRSSGKLLNTRCRIMNHVAGS